MKNIVKNKAEKKISVEELAHFEKLIEGHKKLLTAIGNL
jgi:hypothetical protein